MCFFYMKRQKCEIISLPLQSVTTMEKTIDIDNLLRSKMGDRSNLLPRCIVKWLKRILHEDEVNLFLHEHRDEKGVPWLQSCVEYLGMDLQIEGMDNLPPADDGRQYTFVSNHPLGGIDGVALGALIGKHYDGNFAYLVRDELMFLPGLAPLCIPINKTGKQSRAFPAMVEAGFASEKHMLMFPAGLCSRRQKDGTIRDTPWTKTFVTKSVETHRDIIPIHFGGQNSDKFYRIANICKALHIKFNVAMLFLVDEMYKNRNKTFRISIGKPIPWQSLDKSKTPMEWAKMIQDTVYSL